MLLKKHLAGDTHCNHSELVQREQLFKEADMGTTKGLLSIEVRNTELQMLVYKRYKVLE